MVGPREVALGVLLGGCASTTYRVETLDLEGDRLPSARCSALIVHAPAGDMVVFRSWRLDGTGAALTGEGARWTPDRGAPTHGMQRIELHEAGLVECAAIEQASTNFGTLSAVGFFILSLVLLEEVLP